MTPKTIAVVLSGCGVYDGSEIHESVLTLLALDEAGVAYQCYAPDVQQHHVINHINGEEMKETRNVLVESARIARGNIKSLSEYKAAEVDGVIFPGGFGTAKNHTTWAFDGPKGAINPEVQRVIRETLEARKPIGAICMAPTTIAKALEGTTWHAHLTVGNTTQSSPYEIKAISDGMNATGAVAEMCEVDNVIIDEALKIITSPCYMMDARISEINDGIIKVVAEVLKRA
jgi:enhancing lycopene biosynthesis protein 2